MSDNRLKYLRVVKPASPAERRTHTTTDTILITPGMVRAWKTPPFQRPLRVNDKVIALSERIKVDEVIPGILHLGVVSGETYRIDGQHRVEAFLRSELTEAAADVVTHHCSSISEMASVYVEVNSSLVRMRPDDILRGLEPGVPVLAKIRAKCQFVGYDQIRRGPSAPVLSMSMLLRCWLASTVEVPSTSGTSAAAIVGMVTEDEVTFIVDLLTMAAQAWGRDAQYVRLWGTLNLAMCAWCYRRMVLLAPASSRTHRMTREEFRKCLMALSADEVYCDWLVGRQLSDRDRGPAFNRIKLIFSRRLTPGLGRKPILVQPPWAAHAAHLDR